MGVLVGGPDDPWFPYWPPSGDYYFLEGGPENPWFPCMPDYGFRSGVPKALRLLQRDDMHAKFTQVESPKHWLLAVGDDGGLVGNIPPEEPQCDIEPYGSLNGRWLLAVGDSGGLVGNIPSSGWSPVELPPFEPLYLGEWLLAVGDGGGLVGNIPS